MFTHTPSIGLLQISFLASCSDHSGEEHARSGLEQCTLCVSCPHVVKCFSCSFFGDQLLGVMFHINELKRGKAQKKKCLWVRALASGTTPAYIADNNGHTPTVALSCISYVCVCVCVCVSVCVCVCVWPVCHTRAPVTQGHSCETPLIPLLSVFWVGGWSPSTTQSYSLQSQSFFYVLVKCAAVQHVKPFWSALMSDFSFSVWKSLVCDPDKIHGCF